MKKEIIGYTLQKELFDLEVGTLFYKVGRDEAYRRRVVLPENDDCLYVCNSKYGNWIFNKNHVENFPKWFKPVYN